MDAETGAQEIFGMTDKDQDSWITADEIEEHLKSALENGMPQDEADGLEGWLNSIDLADGEQDDAIHFSQLFWALEQ